MFLRSCEQRRRMSYAHQTVECRRGVGWGDGSAAVGGVVWVMGFAVVSTWVVGW